MLSIEQTQAKVSDLVSIQAAAKEADLSWWQIRRLLDQGKIESVRLPNGHRAVLKSSLERYREAQK